MSRPLVDVAQLAVATQIAVAGGHRLLQTHRISPHDREQVGILLDLLNPPMGATVLDAGCGLGEVARYMASFRPDLTFILANISQMQLDLCPPASARFAHMLADCHQIPLVDSSVDAVMFNSALTQMDAPVALAEAARVVRPGGIVFLFEMVREGGDQAEFEAVTTARVHPAEQILEYAAAAGLETSFAFEPVADDQHFRGALRELGREDLMAPIRPAIFRFIKS